MKITTKSGIQIEIDERVIHDSEFVFLYADMQESKSVKSVSNLIDFLFGSRENSKAFYAAIREKNDGICTQEVLGRELVEILEAMNAKNSSSSDT